jgi:ankyrin repeat protein
MDANEYKRRMKIIDDIMRVKRRYYLLDETLIEKFGLLLIEKIEHDASYDEIRSLVTDNPQIVDFKNNDGESPLELAVQYRRAEIIELLLDMGAFSNVCIEGWGSQICTPLDFARQILETDEITGDIKDAKKINEVIKVLINHGAKSMEEVLDDMEKDI